MFPFHAMELIRSIQVTSQKLIGNVILFSILSKINEKKSKFFSLSIFSLMLPWIMWFMVFNVHETYICVMCNDEYWTAMTNRYLIKENIQYTTFIPIYSFFHSSSSSISQFLIISYFSLMKYSFDILESIRFEKHEQCNISGFVFCYWARDTYLW